MRTQDDASENYGTHSNSVERDKVMRKAAPINVIVHYPTTEEGWRELRSRVASVHADAVMNSIQKLNCPTWQKIKLLVAIIEDAKKKLIAEREMKNNG